ncbi:Tetraspanin family protein [Tritrichomonas foetus]|uniref:Tetraspanin family protein n=1 Tax=Tritrichomonas foetus TaxID=1144522 RepID=A0A1J4L084_9EUKA|nr:Tetraspanin family protein [Tritrichomonas foetus]|eukprot:OHT16921.1 Tetraspanin family protein [Tritrichomonas foetus]
MGCAKCCTGMCFMMLTLCTLGVTLAILIFATIIYSKIRTVNETLFIVIIIALCVTALIFIFGLYASCCGKKCSKGVLSMIYLIYAIALGACGVLILIYKNKLVGMLEDVYNKGKLSSDDISSIEEFFKCSFENKTELVLLNETDDGCFNKFEDYVKKYGLIIGIVLLVIFVLLMFGVIMSCRLACKKEDISSGSKQEQNNSQITSPLTYGW